MSEKTIGAAVLHTLGGRPDYEQFPAPQARDGEVLVRVTAAALKPVDRLMASGGHYASYARLPRRVRLGRGRTPRGRQPGRVLQHPAAVRRDG
jgi:hypothetical protein